MMDYSKFCKILNTHIFEGEKRELFKKVANRPERLGYSGLPNLEQKYCNIYFLDFLKKDLKSIINKRRRSLHLHKYQKVLCP